MEVLSLCGIMGLCAWEDWKTKKIHIGVVCGLAIIGLLYHLWFPRLTFVDICGGIGIGCVLYVVSVLSKEQIGRGDALCFMGTGVFLGFWGNLFLLWSSFLVAGVVGLIYSKVKGCEAEIRLPFLPIVFGCLLIQLLVGGGL